MICEVLFPECGNLYGENANMRYLHACAPTLEMHHTHNRETPLFVSSAVDLLYIGSMPESLQELALSRLLPYADRLRERIEAGMVVLATGNASELFGQYIQDGERTIPCLGFYDFYAVRHPEQRHNSMFLGQWGDLPVIGYRSQFSTLHGTFPSPFLSVTKGRGNADGDPTEGYCDHQLFATYLLGPFLVLNPLFTKHLLQLLGLPDRLAFEQEALEAYRFRLESLQAEGAVYAIGDHG